MGVFYFVHNTNEESHKLFAFRNSFGYNQSLNPADRRCAVGLK